MIINPQADHGVRKMYFGHQEITKKLTFIRHTYWGFASGWRAVVVQLAPIFGWPGRVPLVGRPLPDLAVMIIINRTSK